MRQELNRQRTERQGEDLDLIDISREGKGRESVRRSGTGKTGKRTKKTGYRKQMAKGGQKAAGSGDRNRTAEEGRIKRRRRKRQRQKKVLHIMLLLILTGLLALFLFILIRNITGKEEVAGTFHFQEILSGHTAEKPEITEEFLTPNPYSRPQTKLKKVKNIFVHYTANPGTSAEQNRSYFENLGVTGETSASAHFIISYDGSIVQCLPLDEMGYAVKTRNEDSVSIECCYLDEDGKFTDATYQSLLKLSAWLLSEYHLKPSDMRRHYDEGGKKCPLYYVEHEEAWDQFQADLEDLKNSY